ncbi:MAG TPA: arylsulfatase, partial [Mycobacterium sp.]
WVPIYHPEFRISTPYRSWSFTGSLRRMPEVIAPALGNRANTVTIDAVLPENANGVLYALGGAGGGLTCYMDDGYLCYEYNMFIIQRTKIRSNERLAAGRVKIVVETRYIEPRPAGPLSIVITVDGYEAATGTVPISVPLLFTANDCLDIGVCLGGAVSLDYFDRTPFPFTGEINSVDVIYTN